MIDRASRVEQISRIGCYGRAGLVVFLDGNPGPGRENRQQAKSMRGARTADHARPGSHGDLNGRRVIIADFEADGMRPGGNLERPFFALAYGAPHLAVNDYAVGPKPIGETTL